jgi:tetratricopeptide (TPR) repeat protein
MIGFAVAGHANSPTPEKPTLEQVDYYLSKQKDYDLQKENCIRQIKTAIRETSDDQLLYHLYTGLFEEYRSYVYDSAYVCVEKLLDISQRLGNHDKITSSMVKMIFCYLSSGLFKEAFDTMATIDVNGCSDETKIAYFTHKARLYYDLADYNDTPAFRKQYEEIGSRIIDSALILLPQESPRYWASAGLKFMKTGNYKGAFDAFQKMIDTKGYSEHDLAIATSSIAYILTLQNNTEDAKYYLMKAAISDVKSSTKETVALRNLAQLLYESGDLSHAVTYIRQALSDAYFYNARHRQLEIGNILPIIEDERINTIEKQRDRITLFFICISVLLLMLVAAFVVIWKSLKRLNQAQQAIQKVNNNLTNVNNDLTEANKIKDEYIGYFFSQHSEFIKKLEAFQKWVDRKVTAKQYDDLRNFPKNMDIHREREELFSHFDQMFLKMFPDFVNRFNELLKPGEQIQLKKNELLNTDLRIYALIRLGINDNEKIAQFLNYSINTIYAYKTKIKSKIQDSNEEFKQKIMEIKSI